MIAINVNGLLYCAHAALPHLLAAAQDGPRRVADMVNISSVAGRVARSGSGVYNLTKHGVGAFSESLRQEVTGRHVRVSLVEPGAVDTELQQPQPARDPRADPAAVRRDRATALAGHRRVDQLHRHAATAHGDQRGARPPDRAGRLSGRAGRGSRFGNVHVPYGDLTCFGAARGRPRATAAQADHESGRDHARKTRHRGLGHDRVRARGCRRRARRRAAVGPLRRLGGTRRAERRQALLEARASQRLRGASTDLAPIWRRSPTRPSWSRRWSRIRRTSGRCWPSWRR